MNFDFSEEQVLLRNQIRRFLGDRCPSEAVHAVLEGGQSCNRTLLAGLGEMGVLGAAIPEAYGGIGLSRLELCILAEELGRVLAPVPVSSSIFMAAEAILAAGSEAQKLRWLPALAVGRTVGTLALVERAGRIGPAAINASVRAGRLNGVKQPTPDAMSADIAVVAAHGQDDPTAAISLFLVDLAEPGVMREPMASIDPTRPHGRLIFHDARAEPLGGPGLGWSLLEKVIDHAAVLIAFEQVGGADRAVEMARDYALGRMAFGRPIGSFQAIKHMLADMYVSATLARSNAYYGAWALTSASDELPVAAATARVDATQAFLHCARNNIQVHGGIGFTWALDCHLYYRRANALALVLGSLSTWEDLLIERMARAGPLAIPA
jgi:acyl-CoA dehydrogenase